MYTDCSNILQGSSHGYGQDRLGFGYRQGRSFGSRVWQRGTGLGWKRTGGGRWYCYCYCCCHCCCWGYVSCCHANLYPSSCKLPQHTTSKIINQFRISWLLLTWLHHVSCKEPFHVFCVSVVFLTSPHLLQMFRENVAMMFCCEAPEMFCELQKFTPLSIGMEVST